MEYRLHMGIIIFHSPASKHVMKMVTCPQLQDKDRTFRCPGLHCNSARNSTLNSKPPAFACAGVHTTQLTLIPTQLLSKAFVCRVCLQLNKFSENMF